MSTTFLTGFGELLLLPRAAARGKTTTAHADLIILLVWHTLQ